MEKTAKITKCVYNKPWNAPSGDVVHYHSIELDNGDVGNVGVSEKFPPKIAQGSEITYTINNNSIKLLGFSTNSGSTKKPAANTHKEKENKGQSTKPAWQPPKVYRKNPEDYLGFVYGYAKDITIALINNGNKKAIADPVAITNKMSEDFYANIKKLLLDTTPPAAPKNTSEPGGE